MNCHGPTALALLLALTFMSISLVSCGGFKAKRVGADESDEKAMEITDNWLAKDTEQAIAFVIYTHPMICMTHCRHAREEAGGQARARAEAGAGAAYRRETSA